MLGWNLNPVFHGGRVSMKLLSCSCWFQNQATLFPSYPVSPWLATCWGLALGVLHLLCGFFEATKWLTVSLDILETLWKEGKRLVSLLFGIGLLSEKKISFRFQQRTKRGKWYVLLLGNKIPQTECFKQQSLIFSSSGGWISEIKAPVGLVSCGLSPWLNDGHPHQCLSIACPPCAHVCGVSPCDLVSSS